MKLIAGRYTYWPANTDGMCRNVFPLRPMNTREGHARVVAGFNRRDRDKWCWAWEECLPTDYDHPDKERARNEAMHTVPA